VLGQTLSGKNFTVEKIILKLGKIEVLCGQGNTIKEAARQCFVQFVRVKNIWYV